MSAKAAKAIILRLHIGIKQPLCSHLAVSGVWRITVGILQVDTT